jgi:hypothetical protein
MTTEKYPLVVCYAEKNSDIVFAEFPHNLRIDLTAAKEIVSNRLDFMKESKHYLIIDVSNVRDISTEAKEYMQQPDAGLKNILGAAFIATNPVSMLIATIFIKTQKDFPARYFTNKEDAFDWIVDCRTKTNSKNSLPIE